MLYAATNMNNEIRSISSSGGVFYEIAKYVLDRGGIVCGCRFDKNNEVIHSFADHNEGVKSFLGSKYVQSAMGDTFKYVKKYLDSGKLVLFSGTPCQVAGLKAYLLHEYCNLVTVDLACHGVPSPKIWKEYLKYRKAERSERVSFRDKTEGWKKFSIKIGEYRKNQYEDIYMQGFIQNYTLRPACYECAFKGIDRATDITIADLWGAENVVPDMYDDQGISLVVTHSMPGEDIWNVIKENFRYTEINREYIPQNNPYMVLAASRPLDRECFFQNPTFNRLWILAGTLPLFARGLRKIYRKFLPYILKRRCANLEKGESNSRIPTLFDRKEECCGCTACYSICPKNAITMVEDEEGFDYPVIDENRCIQCYNCMRVCPLKGTPV